MNIFKWFKKLKPEIKEETQKEFKFDTLEAFKIGDMYTYTVKAETREEAFIKLVKYFFGEEHNQDIKSLHQEVTWPYDSVFRTNMPFWFAKRIGGYRKEGRRDYQKELEIFAAEHNIKLKK